MSEPTKECPSCALDIPEDAEDCPYCGYELPRRKASMQFAAWGFVVLLLMWALWAAC